MKYYAPINKQLDLGLFRSSLDELDKSNRWVVLGDLLPWTELEKEYNSRLGNQKKGAGNKPARMILGAMIIKHKLNLGDVATIEMIKENPYMQYLCGLPEFTDKQIFDPSLFVTIRKRISEEELNKMTVHMLNKQKRLLEEKRKREEEEARNNNVEPPTPEPEEPNATPFTDSKAREHKGVLKIDATCADAEMQEQRRNSEQRLEQVSWKAIRLSTITVGMPTTKTRTSHYRLIYSKNALAIFHQPSLRIRYT